MLQLLIIAQDGQEWVGLCEHLTRKGFSCSVTAYNGQTMAEVIHQSPDVVLAEMDGNLADSGWWGLIHSIKLEKQLPVMALVSAELLDSIDGHPEIDEFLTSPYDSRELALRVNRLLRQISNTDTDELIECGDMVINFATCEVTLQGRLVELTFKEYELLRFLASHQGRVHTRQTLLDKVWGYDYYGGDRTVDVHIRRLRSKIEDSSHTFVETVRNIGYKFVNGGSKNTDV